MRKLMNKKGFTLIELIIVITILGILVLIAIPNLIGFIESSRLAADQAAVRTLNSLTPFARQNLSVADPFINKNKPEEELIEFLVDSGYLGSIVVAQSKDATFVWNIEDELWYLSSLSQGGMFLTLDDLKDRYFHKIGDYTGVLGFRPPSDHTRFQGLATEVFIPKEIGGQKIKGIYQDFFRYGYDYRPGDTLTKVSFDPNSEIERIHARAFMNNNIKEITLPPSVNRIDWGAFRGNTELKKVTIGDDVELEGSVFPYHSSFVEAYQSGGAGTYIWEGTNWVKQ